jgi:hypothetical protein
VKRTKVTNGVKPQKIFVERECASHNSSVARKDESATPNEPPRVERSVFSVALYESATARDGGFWQRASCEARWQATELRRMIAYAYETPSKRQKNLDIVERD